MKILVLSSYTPSLFYFRIDMMKDFIKRGHTVIAVGDEEENLWVDQFSKFGIKYRKAVIERNGTNPLKDLKTLESLKKIIGNEKPDRIFTYQAKTVIYGGIAANKYNIPTYSLIAGIGSIFMRDGLKAEIIKRILIFEYKLSLKHSKKVFFQNKDDVKIFIDNRIVREEQVVMLSGSGVNLEQFEEQPLPFDFAFLYIGRLIKDKGVNEYLQASRIIKNKYPSIRCLLVGPFDTNPSAISMEDLKPYIEDGTIEYFGEQKDVRPYLAQCNVFVLPSYREGTPKAVLEAMAMGRAIITSDAPGCRETVVDGENGFLVEVKNIEELSNKMIYLYENQSVVEKMGKNGRKIIEDKFDVKIVNDKIIKSMEL